MNEQLIQEIGKFLEHNYGLVAIILGAIIQVAPIKVYPVDWIKALLKWLGKCMFIEIDNRLDKMEKDIKSIGDRQVKFEQDADEKWIQQIRTEILEFDNKITKRQFSYGREKYEHIIFGLYPEYEALLQKYGKENGKVTRAMERINKDYDFRISDDPTF